MAASEIRALWVVRTSLTSRDNIRQMVADSHRAGFNTLFVQVRGRGDAYYRSRIEPRASALGHTPRGFDPLDSVLKEAHRRGMAVHAWMNVHLIADSNGLPQNRDHIIHRHPEWLMIPRDLAATLYGIHPHKSQFLARLAAWSRERTSTVEGLFLSPFHDGAFEHILDVAEDIVEHYPVDGIHFDYLRYPNAQFDYNRSGLEAFAEEMLQKLDKISRQDMKRRIQSNPLAFVDRYPNQWQEFRRARLTALLRQLRARILAKRPKTILSAAVVPEIETARESRGQDWQTWMAQGLLDMICPMAYTTDADAFKAQVTTVKSVTSGQKLLAGVGAYCLSAEQTVQHVSLAREAGSDGFVLFSYDSLTAPDRSSQYLRNLGQELAGR